MKKKEENAIGYKIARAILLPIFKLYYRPKQENKEYIPKEGPIVVCGNHRHLYDQCLAIMCTDRMLHYMAKIEYFRNWKTRWFFKWVGCIPVNRQVHDSNAKDKAIEVLENGCALGIFPEGTRNRTKDMLLPFKFGAVSMAKKTDATIVPFAITGDYKFRSKNLKVTFGKPFKVGDMSLEEANAKLEKTIRDIIIKEEKKNSKKK